MSRLRWGAVALVAVVAVAAWLATRGGDSPSGGPDRVLSAGELRAAAGGHGYPLYWAGPALNAEYALREVAGSGRQVVYLPAGGHLEGAAARELTVGSYPLPDPGAAIRSLARRPGAIVRRAADGRAVVSLGAAPDSAYFASPDNRVEVEVYAPSPRRALRLALSGRVRPVR